LSAYVGNLDVSLLRAKGAFEAVNGWDLVPRTPADEKQLTKACAEWADGELVAAHIGYQNDILCTFANGF
jgi:hypothetical protein